MCVKEGDTIILECAAFAKPAPKITWKKYGGHLLNIKKENSFASNVIFHSSIFILNIVFKKHQFIFYFVFNLHSTIFFPGNLVIKKVHHRDKGTYICLADNGIGNKVQKVFQIEVLGMNNLKLFHANFFVLVFCFRIGSYKCCFLYLYTHTHRCSENNNSYFFP